MQLKAQRKHLPLQKTSLPRYLFQEEVKRLFSVISTPRDRALFALIYHYGLRVEEATVLTLQDVDVRNLHIRIHRLKNGVSGQKPLGTLHSQPAPFHCRAPLGSRPGH